MQQFMSLKDFLKSKIFLKQLLLSFGVTLVSIILVLLVIRIYTRHGQAFPVPDLFGMTEDQYTKALHHVGLDFKVVDSTYNDQVVAGGVVDQIPDAGHNVKRKRLVYLTLNAQSPGKIAIPRLTDISYRQAIVQIESAGLIMGKILYEPSEFMSLVLKARINGKEVQEGEIVNKGSVIDLVLGSGENAGMENLPNLLGMTLSAAHAIINNTTFNLGDVFFDETVLTSTDSLSARIYRQNPDPDFSFQTATGSSVALWLTRDDSKIPGAAKKEKDDFNF
jgi:eukaryotic-like serine/threonine-protein kinase